jgi:hypothetical protein
MRFQIDMDWEPAGVVSMDTSGKLEFPRVPSEPGVYRFRLVGESSTAGYVGESVSMRQRFGNFRNPGPTQPTNQRMNARIKQHLGDGGRVDVSFVRDVSIDLDGQPVEDRLVNSSQRLILENLALIAAEAEGIDQIENL